MDGVRALIAAGATAVCCFLCAFWAFRSPSSSASASSKKQHCCGSASCGCRAKSVNGEMAVGGEKNKKAQEPAPLEGGGASMMEQLVPEITTHALSYLDYTSLCRLSMTNSAMRRAANDDGAWKALYRKDFTVEQINITPPNGWKAYYAATKAIMNLNAQFYNIIREGSLSAMSCFWLNADYVKCIHATGEFFTGYNAVMESWGLLFNWGQDGGQGVAFQTRDVRARVLGEVAWVNMKANVGVDPVDPVVFHVTNVYEFRNSRWYMVHHHNSAMADPAPHNLFG
ncbi:F-box protein SKIP8-like [Phragmites australis]|uniref:F-box protein SKIP8-like n=1 Tax=Phragmites australis TaxID=29695 RepID=UPI002D767EC1|nr:F-box protein SKIP8-like [Phragmites australis]